MFWIIVLLLLFSTVRVHLALNRYTAAAALLKDHLILSVISHFSLCIFLQVKSILCGQLQYGSTCCCFESFFHLVHQSFSHHDFV